jgi:hypothetical protein
MFVRVAFRPGFPEVSTSNRIFGGISKGGDAMHQDNPSTQVFAALNPLDSEPIVLKRRVSAFSGSDLDVLLRAAKAENLVLAGIATSGVVLSTLRQAADLDFGLTVLEDARAWPSSPAPMNGLPHSEACGRKPSLVLSSMMPGLDERARDRDTRSIYVRNVRSTNVDSASCSF